MAAENGPQDPDVTARAGRASLASLKERLQKAPHDFEFFQAVRLIERILSDRGAVGEFTPRDREAVRLRSHTGISFPASQIQQLDWPEGGQPEIFVNFLGLTGPSGVLPLVYTELLRDRIRGRDRTMAEFFDVFHHRLLSLFYRAWRKYRIPVIYESDRQASLSGHVSALIGLATKGLEERQSVEDDSLRYYCGLLGLQPRSASALRDVLIDYFQVPFEIEQFVGGWYPLESTDQCHLTGDGAESEQLGLGAIVGDAIWDQQSKIRIRVGPLTRERYEDFLPTGSAYRPLRELVTFFVNASIDFEVQLVLRRQEVPPCELSLGDGGPMLGWTTWIKTKPEFGRDPDETILQPPGGHTA